MEKDFISATPDTGGQGQTEVQVSAGANPTFQSRETTANFSANGQILKSVKAVQNGIPFVTYIGLACNTAAKSLLEINSFSRDVNGIPRFNGTVGRNILLNPSNFFWTILVGGLVSWYDETQDDELIAEFSWYTNTGAFIESNYNTLTFDNEDGEDWKNYVLSMSGTEVNPNYGGTVNSLLIKLGQGRGDTGLYEGTEFMSYRLVLINQ